MKIINYIKNPKRIIIYLMNIGCFRFLSDKTFIKMKFKLVMGRSLNLDKPITFNEKIQWLKLYDHKEEYTTMVDKEKVKEYVSNIIGEQYIIKTYGVYDSFDEIDFDKLPNKFVIKCTHDSGGIVICSDKNSLDKIEAKKKINKFLSRKYYYVHREWPYKNIKPRIIIEKYMEDSNLKELRDYKFFCFNGNVEFFKIDFDRYVQHGANYFDKNLNLMKFGEVVCPPNFEKKLDIPKNIYKMIEYAEKLSKNIPFARIDFYDVNDHVYFGEITLYPAAGFGKFDPEEWDYKLGNLIRIKNNEK